MIWFINDFINEIPSYPVWYGITIEQDQYSSDPFEYNPQPTPMLIWKGSMLNKTELVGKFILETLSRLTARSCNITCKENKNTSEFDVSVEGRKAVNFKISHNDYDQILDNSTDDKTILLLENIVKNLGITLEDTTVAEKFYEQQKNFG